MLTKTPRNGKNGKGISRVTELPKISTSTDTREILAHAAKVKGKTTTKPKARTAGKPS